MKFSPDAIIDDLIDGVLVCISRRHELSWQELKHWWCGQNLPVEEKRFYKDLPIYRIGQPTRIDSRGLKWISGLNIGGTP